MKYSVFKKTVSVLLAILILLSLLPAGVLAAEEGGTEESEENSAQLEQWAEALITYYTANGLDVPLAPLAMHSLTDSKTLEGANVNVPYYGTDSYYSTNVRNCFNGSQAMAIIDTIAAGGNPRNYPRAMAGSGEIVYTDLIQELLDQQNPENGSIFSTLSGNSFSDNLALSILALEMFFGGQNWGNEMPGTKLGRSGAIEYFLSQIRPFKRDGAFDVENGYLLIDSQELLNNGLIPNPLTTQYMYFPHQQSAAIALLVRLKDSDTLVTFEGEEKPVKDVVQPFIDGIMKVLDAMYRGDKDTLNCTEAQANTGKTNITTRTNNLTGYISSLIAVGRQADAKNALLNYLSALRLEDGTFPLGSGSENKSFHKQATAYAARAIGDLLYDRAILTTLSFNADDVDDAEAVKIALGDISLPETALENLLLPKTGAFGCALNWHSTNPDVIDPETGIVTRPAAGEPSAHVTLTVTVSRGAYSVTASFYIVVLAESASDDLAVVTADANNLKIPLFVTENIVLPSEGESGQTTITWLSENPGAIAPDGTVMLSEQEQKVKLTARVEKGEAVVTRDFNVTVGRIYDPSDIVTDAVYKMRAQYNTSRELTNSYWQVWAAKSVLGDAFDDYDFSVYNVKNHRLASAWQGTDYGAVVLQIIAQGDNPYNYQGTDYVQKLLDYINRQPETSKWGAWGSPIFLAMALDAAGAEPPEGVEYPVSQLLGWTKSLGSGPDLAAWSMIPLAGRLDEVAAFINSEGKTGLDMIEEFRQALIAKQYSGTWNNPALGEIRTNTNKSDDDGISYTMSNACVVMGAAALSSAEPMEGFAPANWNIHEWKKRSTNKTTGGAYVYASPVDALYKQEVQGKSEFNAQIVIAFGDLFFGDSVFRRIAVKPEDFKALIATAAEILQNADDYTESSYSEFYSAYQSALAFIVGDEVKPNFGRAYFTLRDAIENLKPAGSVSVRVLGAEDVMYDIRYVAVSGNVLDVLGAYASEYQISQTSTTTAIEEIGGLKGEWRVYNVETRVTDLTAPLDEGAALTFKYTPNPEVVPQDATLDEHLVCEAAARLTMPSALTESITLPISGAFGVSITWISSNSLYFNHLTGEVRRAEGDVKVTLTATVSGPNGATKSVPFEITILGTNPSETKKQYAWISVIDPNPPAGRPSVYFAKQKIEIGPGETAFTLLQKTGLALRVNPHTQYGVYVEAIEGYGEFDDGPYSGWVCKVNGVGIGRSSALVPIHDGDVVEWLYTRDLGRDAGIIWDGDDSPRNGKGEPAVLSPKVTASNGTAAVAISVSDMNDAIAKAKENESTVITIAPEISGTAKKATINLPSESLMKAAEQTNADITVNTPVGSVTLPNSVLQSIAAQASDSTVTVSLAAVDPATLTAEQQKAIGEMSIYDISILSGNKNVSSFGGGSIIISLPYTLKDGEEASGVTVWYMDEAGRLHEIETSYSSGYATFVTTHLSYYLVGYAETWKNPFKDVTTGDWFYEYVEYVARNKLMTGTSDTTFEPNADITRAMLVTVLYRMEGKPAVTGTSAFTDVQSGQWYTDAIVWASANNIVRGYGNGLFGANDKVTREQLATILFNYARFKGYDVSASESLSNYSDANDVSVWAQEAVRWAVAKGIITGRTATTIVPLGNATRAEVAAILMRFAKNVAR